MTGDKEFNKLLKSILGKFFKDISKPALQTFSETVQALMFPSFFTLRDISSRLQGTTNVKHKLKRLQNFLDRFDTDAGFWDSYSKLIFSLPGFRFRSRKYITILLDATTLRDDFWILSASVSFKGRAVPIYLRMWADCHARYDYWARVDTLLKGLKPLLPPDKKYVIVADRGFQGKKMFELLDKEGLYYVVRVNDSYRVNGGYQLSLFDDDGYHPSVMLGKKNPHRTDLTVCSKLNEEGGRIRWFLAGSLGEFSGGRSAADIYERRMWIEESFRDLKTYMKWEKYTKKVPAKKRMEGLINISCVSYAIGLCLGSGIDVPPSEIKKTSALSKIRHIFYTNADRVKYLLRKIIAAATSYGHRYGLIIS